MTILVIGLVIFFSIHLLPSFVNVRTQLIANLGENKFKGIYSLISAIGFITIVFGMLYADFIPVWSPPVWGRHAAMTLMLPAVILLGAANAPTNLKRITRHPMLWGVTLWATAHLIANGDLASLLLFTSFALYSLFDMGSANRRGATINTESLPFKADIKLILIGLVIYGLLLFLHPYLTGKTLLVF